VRFIKLRVECVSVCVCQSKCEYLCVIEEGRKVMRGKTKERRRGEERKEQKEMKEKRGEGRRGEKWGQNKGKGEEEKRRHQKKNSNDTPAKSQ
jgi:ABC-type multidrug transport system ATPase subunit